MSICDLCQMTETSDISGLCAVCYDFNVVENYNLNSLSEAYIEAARDFFDEHAVSHRAYGRFIERRNEQ